MKATTEIAACGWGRLAVLFVSGPLPQPCRAGRRVHRRAPAGRLGAQTVRALNWRICATGSSYRALIRSTPEQYTAFIKNEISKWAKVIQAAGINGE